MKHYIIHVWGCVDTEIHGPFPEDQIEAKARELYEDQSTVAHLTIDDEGKPSVCNFSANQLDSITSFEDGDAVIAVNDGHEFCGTISGDVRGVDKDGPFYTVIDADDDAFDISAKDIRLDNGG